MSNELISAEAVGLAATSWFAGKVFGPSAEALGENLQAYLAARIPSIFAKADQVCEEKNIDPEPIAPGLLARLVMDASFSEDTPEITDWWANLFVDAAQFGDNLHATFSDMMAFIGPIEAAALSDFCDEVLPKWKTASDGGKADTVLLSNIVHIELIRKFEHSLPLSEERFHEVGRQIATADLSLPVKPYAWSLPMKQGDDRPSFPVSSENWYLEHRLSFEVLQRAGVLRSSRIPINLMSTHASWIDVLELTTIGYEFCLACRGEREQK